VETKLISRDIEDKIPRFNIVNKNLAEDLKKIKSIYIGKVHRNSKQWKKVQLQIVYKPEAFLISAVCRFSAQF
jgi:hypothetical protein